MATKQVVINNSRIKIGATVSQVVKDDERSKNLLNNDVLGDKRSSILNAIPKWATFSKAYVTLECADSLGGSNGEFKIVCGSLDSGYTATPTEDVLNKGLYSTDYLDFKSNVYTDTNAGLPKNDLLLWIKSYVGRDFYIRNFTIDYTFTYPTYQINAEVKAMSDGISTTTPGRIVVIADSGYTSFTLNSKFNVDKTSKKYGIRAEPYYGFKFSKWEDGSASNTKTWTISDSSINSHTTQTSVQRPVFVRENYTISSPTTTGGEVTGTGSYPYEQNITITAVPSYGYHFVQWKEDGVTSASRSIKVTENKTYTPVFESNSYSIVGNISPAGAGSIGGTGTYKHNAVVTLTAYPISGYSLLGWKRKDANNSSKDFFVLNLRGNESETVTNKASHLNQDHNFTETYKYNTVSFKANESETYTAVFIKTQVTYDSIFSYPKWKANGISSSKAQVIEWYDDGFMLSCIANDGDGYTLNSLTIPVEKNRPYKFECDVTGENYEFFIFNCPTRYNDSWNSFSGEKYKHSTTSSFTFTPQTDYIAIRCDSNGLGNNVIFRNFRIYPAWQEYDYYSKTLPGYARADDGKWSPPRPNRQGYKFLGWYPEPGGQGELYLSSTEIKHDITKPYPTEDLVLYSSWENTQKATFRVTFASKKTVIIT